MKQDLVKIESDTTHLKNGVDSVVVKYKNYYGTRFTEIKKDTIPNIIGMYPLNIIPYKKDNKPTYVNISIGIEKYLKFIFLTWLMIIFVTMVYGPVAAFLVELFPTKIRYTSMSLPYHIGNGVFGGLVPFIGLLLTTATNNPLAGLWYPIGVAGLCFVIGALYLSNKIDKNADD
jgi:hypothetical protein